MVAINTIIHPKCEALARSRETRGLSPNEVAASFIRRYLLTKGSGHGGTNTNNVLNHLADNLSILSHRAMT